MGTDMRAIMDTEDEQKAVKDQIWNNFFVSVVEASNLVLLASFSENNVILY